MDILWTFPTHNCVSEIASSESLSVIFTIELLTKSLWVFIGEMIPDPWDSPVRARAKEDPLVPLISWKK
jgi:hypothetical protein